MLSYVLITLVASQLTLANGFLEQCQFNRSRRIDDDLVVDVLENFYRDLADVQAIRGLPETETRNFTDDNRADALDVLKLVHKYVLEVDKTYNVRKSPDYDMLSELHNRIQWWMAPLNVIRKEISNRLETEYTPVEGERVSPALQIYRGQDPVDKDAVESILCEFVRKMEILVPDGPRWRPPTAEQVSEPGEIKKTSFFSKMFGRNAKSANEDDYSDIVFELNSMDAEYANLINLRVVKFMQSNPKKAYANVNNENLELTKQELHSSDGTPSYKQVYTQWLRAEVIRSSLANSCDADSLRIMMSDVASVRSIRETLQGVALGRLLELETKVLLPVIKCFHRRLRQPPVRPTLPWFLPRG